MGQLSRVTLVAGGAGFVGSAVVRELLEAGERVVSFDNYLHGTPANLLGLPVSAIHGDALDEHSLARAIRDHAVTHVIDCIGDTFVPTAYRFPRRFFDINLHATLNILRAAQLFGVERVVYVSSTEVYGITGGERIGEETPLAPVNTYAVSKLAADRLCYTFAVEHGIPVVVARIFNCYGPRESQPYIIPEIISQLNRGEVLNLGNVQAERDFTYVHDTARALVSLLDAPVADGDAVNVGSDCSYRIEWLVHELARIMGRDHVEIRCCPSRLRRLDIDRFQCDNRKLKRLTGWEPRVGIEQGLRATVQWYRDNGCRWSWEAFTDGAMVYR